jgi:hypothetical protein
MGVQASHELFAFEQIAAVGNFQVKLLSFKAQAIFK